MLAPTDQDLIAAGDEAFLVGEGGITRIVPTVAQRRLGALGLTEILLHDAGATGDQLTDLIGRRNVFGARCALPRDPHFHVDRRLANATEFAGVAAIVAGG